MRRIREVLSQSFVRYSAKKYSVNQLVYFEQHEDIAEAIRREKRLKYWNRRWKLELIEKGNPNWRDL